MGKQRFSTPIKKHETVIGWIYLIIHIFLMGDAVFWLNQELDIGLDAAHLNFVYYAIGFVILLVFLFNFLKKSFSDLCDNFGKSVTSIIVGYAGYYVFTFAVISIVSLIKTGYANPNDGAVGELLPLNPNVMKATAVFLAPVVEEVLFRGVVFGSIRKSNRALAYIVSALLFSVYHIWSFVLADLNWSLLIYVLQYLPASVMLAWCYERSKNIWAPILLHMLVNFISVSVRLLF